MLLLPMLFLVAVGAWSQDSVSHRIRIVDTLTAQEKQQRNPVLLRSEIDSLLALHEQERTGSLPQEAVVKPAFGWNEYLLGGVILLLLGTGVLSWLLYRNQQRFNETAFLLSRQVKNLELAAFSINSSEMNATMKSKTRVSVSTLEKKVQTLNSQLEKLAQEKEALEQVAQEYAESKLDFESVKQQMMEVYKIRNYPGFHREKSETEIVKSLLETERSIALYAYEHFLKPVLTIADANKNNPAKIDPEDKEKMLDLLLSLALMYSEYLYLRINDLSVGGKMVERIASLRNGNAIDPALLKQLNVEHGSRALVLRMVLDKSSVNHLSYPVFDETNLNLS
jgi:hypothetical protein